MTTTYRTSVAQTALVALCAVSLLGMPGPAQAASTADQPAASPNGQYIVVLRPGADEQREAADAASRGVAVKSVVDDAFTGMVVKTTASQASTLAQDPDVLRVEPDALVTIFATIPWGLDRLDQPALPLDGAYSPGAAPGPVSAYVFDTGVRADHVEFGSRVLPGFTAIQDGNGTTDCHGHGTHVAGTLAGSTTGVAPSAAIVPVRVLSCTGSGSISGIITAIDWAIAHHQTGTAAVANFSLGGPVSVALDTAVQALIDDGVVVVVAAGNSATDACTFSPARVPAAVTVAASTVTDQPASFSNRGPCVDLYAPGAGIVSAGISAPDARVTLSGTSMASPHVAGIAALAMSQRPSATAVEVASLVPTSAVSAISPVPASTTARLAQLVPPSQAVPTPPGPVAGLTATAGPRSASASWTAADPGSSPATSVTAVLYAAGTPLRTLVLDPAALSVNFTSLTAGIPVRVGVRVSSAAGPGPEVLSEEVTPAPAQLPGAPQVQAVAGALSATVTWEPGVPGSDPVVGYQVVAYAAGQAIITRRTSAPSRTITLSGLQPGVEHVIGVRALTAAAPGPEGSSTPVVPLVPQAPGEVVSLTAVGAVERVQATWAPPASPGSYQLLGYEVSLLRDGSVLSTAKLPARATTHTFARLAPGAGYQVVVAARSRAGLGALTTSAQVVVAPATAPAAPSALAWSATSRPGVAVASWSPGFDGGRPVAYQQVTLLQGTTPLRTIRLFAMARAVQFTGLVKGQSYSFTVVAVNAVGSSPAASSPVFQLP